MAGIRPKVIGQFPFHSELSAPGLLRLEHALPQMSITQAIAMFPCKAKQALTPLSSFWSHQHKKSQYIVFIEFHFFLKKKKKKEKKGHWNVRNLRVSGRVTVSQSTCVQF